MGPFSGPESGQPKRGTHCAYPSWVVRFLGRKTAPYLEPVSVKKKMNFKFKILKISDFKLKQFRPK